MFCTSHSVSLCLSLSWRWTARSTTEWGESGFLLYIYIYDAAHVKPVFSLVNYMRWISALYRIWALMTWTMLQWPLVENHEEESLNQMLCMQPPDRFRRQLNCSCEWNRCPFALLFMTDLWGELLLYFSFCIEDLFDLKNKICVLRRKT